MAKIETKKRDRHYVKRGMNPNSLANLMPPVQPGEIRNPTGPPKAKTQLLRYICYYLSLTPKQLKRQLKADDMTLAQRGALDAATKIGRGEWQRTKQLIERDAKSEGEVDQSIKLIIEYIDASSKNPI